MERSNKKLVAIIVLLLILVLALGSCLWGGQILDRLFKDKQVEVVEKNHNAIVIPGFELLSLTADSKRQEIAFENPAQNDCYFVITLLLEDGTRLWESNYIKPGKTSKKVKLEKSLEEGTYANATLKYSCYTLEDKRQLDGAEVKLTLKVEK